MDTQNYNIFNFTKILNIKDVEKGFKRLSKKKKYKDPYDTDNLLRYLKKEDRVPNKLKLFIDDFKVDKKVNLQKITQYYKNLSSYSLDPYSAYAIPKPGKPGKFRPLLVPEPKDRLLFDSLLPIIIESLREFLTQRKLLGLGLTKKQKISDIVSDIHVNYIQKGYHHVLILDFSSFFSLIDREILINRLHNDGINNNIVMAIDHILNNKIQNGEIVEKKTGVLITRGGIPQGLSFSPILACYYALDIDDLYIKNKDIVGFRYIDDIMILGKNPQDLVKIFNLIKIKADELKMELHPLGEKSQLKCLHDETFTYLGVDVNINQLSINEQKFCEFVEIITTEIFPTKVLTRKDYKEIKKTYFNFIRGWLNHYESISADKNLLYKKLDCLIKKTFSDKNRSKKMPFYGIHKSWIIIENNKELFKKK